MSSEAPGRGRGPADQPEVSVGDLLFDARLRLENLVERETLQELCRSVVALFGIPVRIYSTEGALLADAAADQELCLYLNGTRGGTKACSTTVGAVRASDPGDHGDAVHPCFTGANYRIISLDYDRRRVGRLIIGPFLPATVAEAPASLLGVDAELDKQRAQALLWKMPRAKADTVTRIAAHLKAALDAIMFSGHRAFMTTQVHLASVRESYRQLEDKATRLQEAFDRLQEVDQLKSAFLATVSHELRTPLTSIIGYSEMLIEGLAGDMQPEQLEFVRTIHEKGGHLLSLIMGLLDLGKLESGTMRMTKKRISMSPVLGEVISTLLPAALKKDVKLELDLAPDLASVRGDPERLRQVFLNLVENAIKFTPAGGSVTLQARMARHEYQSDASDEGFTLLAPTLGRVQVSVIDTGIGVPMHERPKIFDAFYQIDSSTTRAYGGTGLGLSIVKRLVEGHGGTIQIEDNKPQGSVFVVSLPQLTPSIAPGHA